MYWPFMKENTHQSLILFGPWKHTSWNSMRTFSVSLLQYIPRNMHTVFALLCFVVVIHWLIFPYPSGLLHWHCGNLTIAPVPAKQPWWIWINTSCEFILNDSITTTNQSTTKPCAYFLEYTVCSMVKPVARSLCYHMTSSMFGQVFNFRKTELLYRWIRKSVPLKRLRITLIMQPGLYCTRATGI